MGTPMTERARRAAAKVRRELAKDEIARRFSVSIDAHETGPKALAEITGGDRGKMSRKRTPGSGVALSVAEVQLMAESGDEAARAVALDLLRGTAKALGMVIVEAPTGLDTGTNLNRLREILEAAGGLSGALADGLIDPSERRSLMKELPEGAYALLAIVADLEAEGPASVTKLREVGS